MSVFKVLRFSNQIECILRIQTPIYKTFPPSPLFIIRTLHSSPEKPIKKPMSLLFQEAVGLIEIDGDGAQSQSKAEKNELTRVKKRESVDRGKPKRNKKLVEVFGGEREEDEVDEMMIMGLVKKARNWKEKPVDEKKEKERVDKGKPKQVKSLIELFGNKKKEEKVDEMDMMGLGKEVRNLKEKPIGKRKEIEIEKGNPNKAKSLIKLFGGKNKEENMVKVELGKEVRSLKEKPRKKMKEKEGLVRGKPKKNKSSIEMLGGEKKEEKTEKIVKVRRERGDVRVLKDLSQLAETFIRHLYAKGYFSKANFLEVDDSKLVYIDNSYSKSFIKFGKDHQEITRYFIILSILSISIGFGIIC